MLFDHGLLVPRAADLDGRERAWVRVDTVLVRVHRDGEERTTTLESFEDEVRSGAIGPDAVVRIGDGPWTPAGLLPQWTALHGGPEAAVRGAWDTPRIPWVTAAFTGLCIRIYLLEQVEGPREWLFEWGARPGAAILERGEVWRLLSHGFLHADPTHIVSNLTVSAWAGLSLETLLGPWNVLLLLLGSIVAGGIASTVISPEVSAVGSSGGTYGLMAALVIVGWRWSGTIPTRARYAFGLLALLFTAKAFLDGLFSGGPVDNAAHLGGLSAGAFMAAFLRPEVAPDWVAANRRTRRAFVLLLGLASAGLGVLGHRWVEFLPWEGDGAEALRPATWNVAYTVDGTLGFVSDNQGTILGLSTSAATLGTEDEDAVNLLDDYAQSDPNATIERRESASIGGREAERVVIRYTPGDSIRIADVLLCRRGRYLTRATVDTYPSRDRFSRIAAERFVSSLALTEPRTVARERLAARGSGARAVARRAEAEASIGNVDLALRDLADAERDAQPSSVFAITRLRILREHRRPEAMPIALAAADQWPEDPLVLHAAADALANAGEKERAMTVLVQGLRVAPGDTRLQGLLDALSAP